MYNLRLKIWTGRCSVLTSDTRDLLGSVREPKQPSEPTALEFVYDTSSSTLAFIVYRGNHAESICILILVAEEKIEIKMLSGGGGDEADAQLNGILRASYSRWKVEVMKTDRSLFLSP